MTQDFSPISPIFSGLRCRYPRCGMGRLFKGILSVCDICDLNLQAEDSGFGPTVFFMFIVEPTVLGLAFSG